MVDLLLPNKSDKEKKKKYIYERMCVFLSSSQFPCVI